MFTPTIRATTTLSIASLMAKEKRSCLCSSAGKRNFEGRDKGTETASKLQGCRRRDKASLNNPANSGAIAESREISVSVKMRGGPERTRTPGTQFYGTSFCHCPMLQARAHRAGAKVTADAANQTNTAGVVSSALILRSNIAELRNDIVEKRLAIRADWSGTVVSFRAPRALRDPAPPARSPWWGFGGAAAPANRVAATAWRYGGDIVWSIGNVRLI
jgi:hypothetical protein